MEKIGILIVAIAMSLIVWFVNHPPEKQEAQQVEQLEQEMGRHYLYASYLLGDTVEEFLAWNFKESLSETDEAYINKLNNELLHISGLMFSGDVIHSEWSNRVNDILDYLNDYIYGKSLSEEEILDLHQALQATRFISMDFKNSYNMDYYDAMHDEQHEMAGKDKNRLVTQY